MDVKLKAFDMPHDISIDILSDAYLSEEEREDLKCKLKSGLLGMPTIEELHQKVISLHEDIIDDGISRELGVLQKRAVNMNIKGQRQEWQASVQGQNRLKSLSLRKQLVDNFLRDIANIQVFSEQILSVEPGKEGSPESMPNKGERLSWKTIVFAPGPTEERGGVMRDLRPQGCFTWRKENPRGITQEPSTTQISKEPLLIIKAPPHQGEVNFAQHASTIVHKSKPQLHSNEGLDINDANASDDIAMKLVKDQELLDNSGFGDQITDEELLNCGTRNDAEIFLLKIELAEANNKLSMKEDELKRVRLEMEEEAALHASKIHTIEEDARVSAIKIYELEEDAKIQAEIIRKLEEDAQVSSDKIRKMEEDAQLTAEKIRKLEDEAHLNSIKLRKMGEEVQLSAERIRKLEEVDRLNQSEMSRMERDIRISSNKIENWKSETTSMHDYYWKKTEEANIRKSKEAEDAKIETADEVMTLYKKSIVFVNDLLQLCGPVYAAVWTDALTEIKNRHLTNLNLQRFKYYDPDCWEIVEHALHSVIHAHVTIDQLFTEANCDTIRPNSSGTSDL